jgi:hypothetical protein
MKKDSMLQRIKTRLTATGPEITVAVAAMLVALTGSAFAASGALTAKQKKEVKAAVKEFPGRAGPTGAYPPQRLAPRATTESRAKRTKRDKNADSGAIEIGSWVFNEGRVTRPALVSISVPIRLRFNFRGAHVTFAPESDFAAIDRRDRRNTMHEQRHGRALAALFLAALIAFSLAAGAQAETDRHQPGRGLSWRRKSRLRSLR